MFWIDNTTITVFLAECMWGPSGVCGKISYRDPTWDCLYYYRATISVCLGSYFYNLMTVDSKLNPLLGMHYTTWPTRKKIVTVHSQKQSAHCAVDVTAQVVPCWLSSWLNRNVWLALGQSTQLAFQFIQLDITWVHCRYAADSGNTQLRGRKISWVSCIRTGESSLHLISPFNCISTQTWLRW